MRMNFKKIVRTWFSQSPYTRPGQGRNTWVLECGHERVEKTSAKVPVKTHCRECAIEERREK